MIKKGIKSFLIMCAILIISLNSYITASAYEKSFPNVIRLSGYDRIDTSIEISKNSFEKSKYVILASGDDFPDALCSTPLSKKLDAPILLLSKNTPFDKIKNEIKRLGAENVIIIGGVKAIPNEVNDWLKDLNIKIERIAGKNRYETSLKIAEKIEKKQNIFLVSSQDFPDAVSIAPIATNKDGIILLVDKNSIENNTKMYIQSLSNIPGIYVIGGINAISDEAIKGIKSERISGKNRYDTNIQVIKKFFKDEILNGKNMIIATGKTFPDALTSSALAGKIKAPLVLVNNNLNSITNDFLKENSLNFEKFYVIGGYNATPDKLINDLFMDEGLVSLTDLKQYVLTRVITFKNASKDNIRKVNFKAFLGNLNSANYQINESYEVTDKNVTVSLKEKDYYETNYAVPYLKSGESTSFNYKRNFVNGGIKYNWDLSKTNSDYRGFEDYKNYLVEEPKIECNNELIMDTAKNIVGNEKNVYLKAKKIYEYVNTKIEFDFSEKDKGAYDTLITKKGVCEGFASLFVAMCRSVGVPARMVYGHYIPLYNFDETEFDGYWYKHAWAEFYLPEYGWIFADPTMQKMDNKGKPISSFEYFAGAPFGDHFFSSYSNVPYTCSYERERVTDNLQNIIQVIKDEPFFLMKE